MKIFDVPQGSPEWLNARAGMPTASQFGRIVTAKKLQPSTAQDKYLHELLAEWMLGGPLESASAAYMERGVEMEMEAVGWYDFEGSMEGRPASSPVGVCYREVETAFSDLPEAVGASPDRLVGEGGGLEVKCPSPAVHVSYMYGSVAEEYRLQVQGGLWVTGRKWWDVISYNPRLPKVLERVEPDDEVQAALEEHVPAFARRLAEAKREIADKYPELFTGPVEDRPRLGIPTVPELLDEVAR